MKNRFLSAVLLAAICLSLCPPARAAVSYTETIPCVYDSVGIFSEGLAAIERNGKWGYIDTTGAVVISPEYDAVKPFSGGFAVVERSGKWGCIDATGAVAVPLEHSEIKAVSEGLAAVERNGKWGYVNTTGAMAVSPEYDAVKSFSEGLAAVERNGKWGYIDATGAVIVPLEYDVAEPFSEGLAVVRRNWKYGYIDVTGALIVPLKYDAAESFSGGLARVWQNGKCGYISKTGLQTASRTYDAAKPSTEDLAAAERDAEWGNAGGIAYARTQTVEMDGRELTLSTYALKNADGSETGYVRLRDIAHLLSGTAAAFNVEWDGAVSITTKTDYAPDGGEMGTPFTGDRAYQDSAAATRIDGAAVALHSILLTDADGGGYTYYRLQDLAGAIGFTVDWSAERVVITTK